MAGEVAEVVAIASVEEPLVVTAVVATGAMAGGATSVVPVGATFFIGVRTAVNAISPLITGVADAAGPGNCGALATVVFGAPAMVQSGLQ